MSAPLELDQLNDAIRQYIRLSGKSAQEALKKQAAKLGYALKQELRGISPAKGSIRSEALARLESGGGIKVRPSVLRKIYQQYGARSLLSTQQVIFGKRGKTTTVRNGSRLNLWALAVKAEIGLRESARGFLGISASYRGLTATLEAEAQAFSKYGPVLSKAGFKPLPDNAGGAIEFEWNQDTSQLSGSAAEGITKEKGDAAINRALRNTLEDIEVYLERKLQEDWSS